MGIRHALNAVNGAELTAAAFNADHVLDGSPGMLLGADGAEIDPATISGGIEIYTLDTLPDPTEPRLIFVSDEGVMAFSNGEGWFPLTPGTQLGLVTYNEAVMASLLFTTTNGQSLAQTHSGGMNETLASPYAARAFPRSKTSTDFSDLITNVVATDLTISGGATARLDGESPILGQLKFGYDLARTLINVDAVPHVGVNRGYGSTAISAHVKGQGYYANTINALTAAKAYATSLGRATFDLGYAWFQGESDAASTKAAYQATLQALARDYAADRKAITGQSEPPAMFTYITDSNPINTATRSGIARAQHQAAIDYFNGTVPSGHTVPAPVILATPTYFMPRLFDNTGVHVAADWAYMLGAYVALAQFHCYQKASALPLNQRWPPIIPTAVDIAGGVATITYQMRIAGTSLALGVSDRPNGNGIPAQTNFGFGVHNGTSLQAVSSVELVGANQVRITLASGSFAPGWRIGYALDYIPVKNLYATQAQSSAGNLRDNYGESVRCNAMNLPMHNWVAPHDITLGASNTWSIS